MPKNHPQNNPTQQDSRDLEQKRGRNAEEEDTQPDQAGQDIANETRRMAQENAGAMQQGLEQGAEAATRLGRENMDAMTKGYDDLTRLNRETLEALMEVVSVTARNFEAVTEQMASFARVQLDDGVQTMQTMARAHNLQDMIDAQNQYGRALFDHCLDHCLRLSDMSLRITEEALTPLSERMRGVMERMGRG